MNTFTSVDSRRSYSENDTHVSPFLSTHLKCSNPRLLFAHSLNRSSGAEYLDGKSGAVRYGNGYGNGRKRKAEKATQIYLKRIVPHGYRRSSVICGGGIRG